MQPNTKHCCLNTTLRAFSTITLLIICALLYQLRPLQTDSAAIQDRITNLNSYSEQRHNNLSAAHDQLKSELEGRMAILDNRIKLLQGRIQ